MIRSQSARERLRLLGQIDLGSWIEVTSGEQMWSIQRRIATALSKPMSRVIVPSCNSSGKTFLAARLALAFYDSFFPGTPCVWCGGPCRGAKIITTSSKEEHLKNNLWGEIRTAYPRILERVGLPGRLYEGDLRLQGSDQHFIIGQGAASAEGMQGYHAPHKLIIGDEATAVSEEVALGIRGLLASGDARMLLIFNPTGPDTFAYTEAQNPRNEVIKITAWDTPWFTGEPVPRFSTLITPRFLEYLETSGLGPGSYEWETRVAANFWHQSDTALLSPEWVDKAWEDTGPGPRSGSGPVQMGIDLASYGDAENVVVVRQGDEVLLCQAFPSGRVDHFWLKDVRALVEAWEPDYLVWDADGVGAGSHGYAEAVSRASSKMCQPIPFRGAVSVNDHTANARSAWWWELRRRFQTGRVRFRFGVDQTLRNQLLSLQYDVIGGKIRVRPKNEMKRMGIPSPDRADAMMYSFSMSEALSTIPDPGTEPSLLDEYGEPAPDMTIPPEWPPGSYDMPMHGSGYWLED